MADPRSVDLVAARQAIYAAPGFKETMKRILVLQDVGVRRRNMISDAGCAQITADTLVLWTTHDPTNPVEEGARISSLIPK